MEIKHSWEFAYKGDTGVFPNVFLTIACAATVSNGFFGWPPTDWYRFFWGLWLLSLLDSTHRRLKSIETSIREMRDGQEHEMREMREHHARELNQMLEKHEACDKKAQRALAAILEVSVEFSDVQRRLENTESALSRPARTRHVDDSSE
jgi:hypothetical protein